eukprot:6474878-Amphidinium_carterae.1
MHPQQQAEISAAANTVTNNSGRARTAEHTRMESVSSEAARHEKPYNAVVKASDNISLRQSSCQAKKTSTVLTF